MAQPARTIGLAILPGSAHQYLEGDLCPPGHIIEVSLCLLFTQVLTYGDLQVLTYGDLKVLTYGDLKVLNLW